MSAATQTELEALEAIRTHARPLGGSRNLDNLIDAVKDKRVVLIGEASHGTHEFYAERARISRRLIAEHGFRAIAIEGDWPDAYRVNRWVHGAAADSDAERALRGFERFPTWMWRNADVLDFVGWLRDFHDTGHHRASFFGLDLYSLYRSIECVISHLDRIDPDEADAARARYSCFDRFERSQDYGAAVMRGVTPACHQEVMQQLTALVRAGDRWLRRDGIAAEDEQFHAEENARLVVDAERYYRAMFTGRAELSWNLRDRHMAGTLARLLAHLDRHDPVPAKVIVWAHNSHVGDARRTEMSLRGELNLGQLTREAFPGETASIGFSTYSGTVTAAPDWDAPARRYEVRPGLPGSYEELMHETGLGDFILDLTATAEIREALSEPRPQRAIGVIYRPETERQSHYFGAHLAEQFDWVLHFDHTRAVEPLEPVAEWAHDEPPETYPSAL